MLAEARPLVAASMWGVTTPCVTAARERLEELGYDVLVFHQTGTGGRSMEELIGAGLVDGVLDVTTTELVDELAGGVWPAGPERLEVAGRLGIPQVVSLGGLDMIAISDRRSRCPSASATAGSTATTSTSPRRGRRAEESAELAKVIARKLNAATGPVALFVPLRGFSPLSVPRAASFDDADGGCRTGGRASRADRPGARGAARGRCDINDPALAVAMAERLYELMAG